MRGEGLRVRLSRLPGETPSTVLRAPLYLPAVLGGFGWTEEFAHTEYSTIRAGQFSQPSQGPATARTLRQVGDLETLTMTWDPVWLVEQGVDPDDVYSEMFGAARARKPIKLAAALKQNERPLLRMDVTIRSIGLEMRKGEPDATYYTVKMTEWRNAQSDRKAAGSGGSDKLPTTHKLTASDTLHSLALRYYKSALKWREIATANSISGVGQSTRLVTLQRFKEGSKLKIPKLTVSSSSVTPGRFS